ncbi:MAG: EAL domain-containing protein [Desulfovibrio sp.]|nr:EAL domain-containing protein [Desulfovibrio sp.]
MGSRSKTASVEGEVWEAGIVDGFGEGYCRWSPEFRILRANAAFLRMMGLGGEASRPFRPIDDAVGRSMAFRELTVAVMRSLEAGAAVADLEVQLWDDEGGRWVRVNARPGEEGGRRFCDVYLQDISRFKADEASLAQRMYHDPLTGLSSREAFVDKLRVAIKRTRKETGYHCAVLSMDLRDFRGINTHFGRDFGDALLRHAARVLSSCCRGADTVARTGGDVFLALLHGPETGAQVIQIIRSIREKLEVRFAVGARSVNAVRAVFGVIFPVRDYENAESVLRDVDIAVDKAKTTHGELGCRFFSRKMLVAIRKHISLSVLLQETASLEDFRLVYQPIVHARDGRLHSFEVLARWSHHGADVSPAIFVPVAEETGLIRRLGAFILLQACRRLAEWQARFGPVTELHVNISPRQIFQPGFPDRVHRILDATGADPSRLLFEVTESVFLQDINRILATISALRNMGIRFCLDDFGTGYSSLSCLAHLPIDCLKIDRSFLTDLEGDARGRILLEHVLSLGRDMGFTLVIEGVEQASQMALLGDLSGLLIQGFHFHRPLPPEAADALLRKEIGGRPEFVRPQAGKGGARTRRRRSASRDRA